MMADGSDYAVGQQPDLYGAAPMITKTKTRRPIQFNMGNLVLCVFVPWLLFSIMFAIASFSIHYFHRALANAIIFVGFLFALMNVKLALDAVKKKNNDAIWMVLYGITTFFAWSTGFALGDKNYQKNTEPFYHVSNLNSYPQFDPAQTPGQQVMDAGRMSFVPGTKVDITRYMAFHNKDTYCVAPVVNPNSKSNVISYDYWAAGMNCCDGHRFACGEYNNPLASSGLRVMRENQRNFFRLAVQQAEAAYNINAKHPLFIYWMQDPDSELGAYLDEGFKVYVHSMIGCFLVLLGAAIATAVALSKM